MTGVLSFIDIDGVEVANAYRTASYLQRGLGPLTLNAARLGCAVLGREVGGNAPFVSPSVDPAPWYDPAVPESAEFLGFVPRLKFQDITVKRNISQRFGSIGGGVIGIEQVAAKGLKADGWLIASSCAGLEYGRHWLYSQLGSDCRGCGLRVVRVRESCPPDDGSNDTRGEKIMYDAALTDGIQGTDDGGDNCCEYDGIGFTISAESPYLYSRPGTATAPVEAQSSEGIAPLPPAVLDTMVRANTGPPPSASWTGGPISGYGNFLRIVSNQLDNQSTTLPSGAYWNAATFAADQACSIVIPTRVIGGVVVLFGRLTTPGSATGSGVMVRIRFIGPGQDFATLGRFNSNTQEGTNIIGPTGTYASSDVFMLTCRGRLLELWRLPTGGTWQRLIATYDSIQTVPAASSVGVGIESVNSVGQHIGAFGGGSLVNGSSYPHDIVSIPVPATKVGIVSPIVTIKAPGTANNASGFYWTNPSVNGLRVQLKKGMVDCTQTDDFAVDDSATRWTFTTSSWQITGGKLKPTATGTLASTGRKATRRDSTGAVLQFGGGRVEATIKTGAVVTAGAWGVGFMFGYGAYLKKATNTFQLDNDANGGGGLDSVAFTPLTGTTYRIICELLPTGTVGVFTCIGYLVDATGAMLTRPLVSTVGLLNPLTSAFQPRIDSAPAGTDEEWDSFVAIDYSDEPEYINVQMPPGTLIVDASRRISQFQSGASSAAPLVEGSAYLSSPIDTPLGWPDLCPGDGPGCLQLWAEEGSFPGNTVSVVLQNRVR